MPDADALDMRAGLEVMGLSLPVWLMRPDIAIGMGGIAAGKAVSLSKLVLDAEVLGYCDRAAPRDRDGCGAVRCRCHCASGPGRSLPESSFYPGVLALGRTLVPQPSAPLPFD